MLCDVDGGHSSDNEGQHGDDGTWREASESADPVSAGAAGADAGSETDEQARSGHTPDGAFGDGGKGLGVESQEQEASGDHPGEEGPTPGGVILFEVECAAKDAADPGDASDKKHHHRDRKSDQRPTDDGLNRRKVRHDFLHRVYTKWKFGFFVLVWIPGVSVWILCA